MKSKIEFLNPAVRIISICLILHFLSCTIGSRPIQYGNDTCAHCEMTIVDQRFGTEIVTEKGKIYTFDSVECLVEFLQDKLPESEKPKTILLTSFSKPGILFEADKSSILYSLAMPSPMGKFLTAFDNYEEPDSIKLHNGGSLFSWKELNEIYNQLNPSMAK